MTANPVVYFGVVALGAFLIGLSKGGLGGTLGALITPSPRIRPQVDGLNLLDERIGLTEYRVHPDSPLAGRTLGEIHLRERLGVNLIGQWHGGTFAPARGPETRIAPGAILVVIGPLENLAGVDALAASISASGPIVVAGYGTVGHKVVEMLRDAGETTVVIDEQPRPGVDVVGNVLEKATLDQARVSQARTVVLALSNDSAGVFATAVIRDYAPRIRLVARVNRAPNVARLYQAGADFALSKGQVAGQLLAYHLLGQSALSVEQRLSCIRVTPGRLVGTHPWKAGVRERSGAAVVAVERAGKVLIELAADFRLRADDIVVICGSGASLDQFMLEFQAAPSASAPSR